MNVVKRALIIIWQERVIAGALLFGAALRFYQLPAQILIGDETHGLSITMHSSFATIFSSFFNGAHSIPMALYYRLMMHTAGLTELTVHIPVLVIGILMIIAVPLLVRPAVGVRASNILAWLLSISPLLLFYSRFSRPYIITLMLGFAASVCFFNWWVSGKQRDAFLYAFLSGLAVYFHQVIVPFIAASFAYAVLLSLVMQGRLRRASLLRLLQLGVITFIVVILPLVAPILKDILREYSATVGKAGHSFIQIEAIVQAFWILAGSTDSIFVTAAVVAFTGIGLLSCLDRNMKGSSLIRYLVFLSLLQVVFVVILKPAGGNIPYVFARYIIPAAPVLLLLTAVGLERVFALLKLNALSQVIVSTVFIASFIFAGPLPSIALPVNNSGHAFMFSYWLLGKDYRDVIFSRVIKRIPEFYLTVAGEPAGSRTIMEVPYHESAYYLHHYQLVHRQKVIMGVSNGINGELLCGYRPWPSDNVRFSSIIDPMDRDLVREKGIDFVVFHKNMPNELHDGFIHRGATYKLVGSLDVSSCIARYHEWYGPPFFEDGDIVVFSARAGEALTGADPLTR